VKPKPPFLKIYTTATSIQTKNHSSDSEYSKDIKIVFGIEGKLLALLNDTEKELFQTFSDARGNMSRIAIADSLVDGFCLAMRITIEVMGKHN